MYGNVFVVKQLRGQSAAHHPQLTTDTADDTTVADDDDELDETVIGKYQYTLSKA